MKKIICIFITTVLLVLCAYTNADSYVLNAPVGYRWDGPISAPGDYLTHTVSEYGASFWCTSSPNTCVVNYGWGLVYGISMGTPGPNDTQHHFIAVPISEIPSEEISSENNDNSKNKVSVSAINQKE